MTNALLLLGLSLAATGHGAAAFPRHHHPPAAFRARVPAAPSAPRRRSGAAAPSPTPTTARRYSDDDGGYEIRSGSGSGAGPEGGAPRTTFGAENVPVDQRPSNEYLNLINAPTFGWASEENGDGGLLLRLAAMYVAFYFAVCYPISGATWVDEGFLLQKVTAANVGATSVVFVMVLRLYSGWGYVGSRLRNDVIEYEESGWYDGDFETKGADERARDLFLYRSDVAPVEARLRKFALLAGGAWAASCLALSAALGDKPAFDQYDGRMLESLRYSDRVAEVVQAQSNGRPTYCENRYYRAVANGGQGCD